MVDSKWQWFIDLSINHINFESGLTDAEIVKIENHFNFRFPPDLLAFLQTALPVSPGFPNWRSDDLTEFREWFDIPLQGVLFDVERNGFWLDEWGLRPQSTPDALELVTELILAAPRLIPIYLHRMMPDEPHSPGSPVFSVHQTDIIYYGFDLADYLCHEFHLPDRRNPWTQPNPIRFWDIDRFQSVRWGDDTGVLSMF